MHSKLFMGFWEGERKTKKTTSCDGGSGFFERRK
jgi:hypothetical protein